MPADTVRALPPIDANQRYTIPETALYLRVSRAYVYRLIDRDEIQSILDGARRYVPGVEIIRKSTVTQPVYRRSARGGHRQNRA